MKKVYVSLTLLLVFLLIIKGEDSIMYAKDALSICSDMIIPTLFPFFICSGILIYSGFCQQISKIFQPVMRPLFNVNPNGSSAFVLGIISGYPLGAVTACQLYEAGYLSKSETERLLAFCNNSGPLFILGSVGIGLYMGLDVGILLYIAHILGTILVGVCMRGYSSGKHTAPESSLLTEDLPFSKIFSLSVTNAANNMLNICATIVFFSVASRLLLGVIPFDVPPFVYGIFEFSGGNMFVSQWNVPLNIKLIFASIITGFAGISVHMQVLAVTAKYGLSVKPYLLGKALHGMFSGAICVVLLYFFDFAPVFANSVSPTAPSFVLASVYCIICTLAICLLFMLAKLKNT